LNELLYYDIVPKHLTSGFRLFATNIVLPKGKTGLHYDTMWLNTDYVTSHIGEISVLSVHFFLRVPPVSDIW
jgi:hypothetical protein